MENSVAFFALFALVIGVPFSNGEICTNPSVKASSYTPSNAEVLTHVAFIAEFTLTCANGAKDVNLYARIEGGRALLPAVRSASNPSKYQVSWTQEVKTARSGDYSVHLYDEESAGAVKRVLESGATEIPESTVKPLVTIVVNFPGAYTGHYLNSELLATILVAVVFYLAYSSKSALLA